MSQQAHIISETDIAEIQQGLMDTETTPTSIDDVPSKHFARKARIQNKRRRDAQRNWDAREIKRVCYNPKEDPNRKHAGMQKRRVPSMAELCLSETKDSDAIMGGLAK